MGSLLLAACTSSHAAPDGRHGPADAGARDGTAQWLHVDVDPDAATMVDVASCSPDAGWIDEGIACVRWTRIPDAPCPAPELLGATMDAYVRCEEQTYRYDPSAYRFLDAGVPSELTLPTPVGNLPPPDDETSFQVASYLSPIHGQEQAIVLTRTLYAVSWVAHLWSSGGAGKTPPIPAGRCSPLTSCP